MTNPSKSSPESPAKEQPGEVAAMVRRLRDFATELDGLRILEARVDADLMREAAALIEKLGQCPRPQIMGEHACKDRTQCWEPCGDLGHHEEYTRPAPPPERP